MKQFSGTGLSVVFMLFLVGAFSVSARDWGFSRDTVHEAQPGPGDSTLLSNSGTDTLRFDSVGLELVRPAASHFEAEFYTLGSSGSGEQSHYLINDQGRTSYYAHSATDPNPIILNPGQTLWARDFHVESRIIELAKSAAFSQGDSLTVRMIFLAHGGRGRDTLIILGKEDNAHSTAILPGAQPSLKPSSMNKLFDLRGRRMEEIPKGSRAEPMPLVSPKE